MMLKGGYRMTELVTIEISKETADKINKVMESTPYDYDCIGTEALNIVAQLYSDLNIGNKREKK